MLKNAPSRTKITNFRIGMFLTRKFNKILIIIFAPTNKRTRTQEIRRIRHIHIRQCKPARGRKHHYRQLIRQRAEGRRHGSVDTHKITGLLYSLSGQTAILITPSPRDSNRL